MGSSESREEVNVVDTTGQVNNNVVVEFGALRKSVHDYGMEIVILLLILCIIKILEFSSYIYINHIRKLKKKYGPGNISTA